MKIFKYEENEITFQKGEDVMINATEMAKPFGKRPVDWLRLSATTSFLKELSEVSKNHYADNVVLTERGGSVDGGGVTWMHEDIAIEFARWLSPGFSPDLSVLVRQI